MQSKHTQSSGFVNTPLATDAVPPRSNSVRKVLSLGIERDFFEWVERVQEGSGTDLSQGENNCND